MSEMPEPREAPVGDGALAGGEATDGEAGAGEGVGAGAVWLHPVTGAHRHNASSADRAVRA